MMDGMGQLAVKPDSKEESTVVVGLGKTGLSVARYLHRAGVEYEVIDSRATPPMLAQLRAEFPDARVTLGEFDDAALSSATRIILSPGVSRDEAAVARAVAGGAELIGDIELFARAADAPVIAITGSNGKSTVTALLGEMAHQAGLDARVGGNFGTPALDLPGSRPPDLYVLELSSFQLELTDSLRPAAATVLNISPDHMDRYAGLEAYAAAKGRVFAGGGVQVVNRDDAHAAALADAGGRVTGFGLGAPQANDFGVVEYAGRQWLARGDERWLPVDAMRLRGQANVANALAAMALATAAGIGRQAVEAALREFRGLAHRCELIVSCGGIDWINDSKATNVGATVAALKGFAGQGNVVLIAGGQGKGADFAPLADAVADTVRAAVLFGADAQALASAVDGVVRVLRADDLESAVDLAAREARPGDTVLLSPACASLDMFTDYQERGAAFAALARKWCGA